MGSEMKVENERETLEMKVDRKKKKKKKQRDVGEEGRGGTAGEERLSPKGGDRT